LTGSGVFGRNINRDWGNVGGIKGGAQRGEGFKNDVVEEFTQRMAGGGQSKPKTLEPQYG